jgi:hypothetical protein
MIEEYRVQTTKGYILGYKTMETVRDQMISEPDVPKFQKPWIKLNKRLFGIYSRIRREETLMPVKKKSE